MTRARWTTGAGSAAALLLLLAAPASAAAPAAAASAEARELKILRPATVGERIEDFSLPDTSGRLVNFSEFAGRVTLLSFWSCYTDTCFTTVKVFEDLIERLGPEAIAAPTVCEEIPPALAADGYAELLRRCSRGQTILIDEDRAVRGALHVRQLPTTIVLDRDLVVREIVRGVPPLRDPALHQRIEALAHEGDGPR